MSYPLARAAVASLLIIAVPAGGALAHAVCGNRVFPPTLTMDDPGVNDELSLPTIQYTPIPAGGGTPSGSTTSYGFEWDKTIFTTPTNALGFALNGDYITQRGAGENLNGWDNFSVTLKDQFFCNEAHEFMMSAGVAREFAGTGSGQLLRAGAIDTVSNTAPILYAGKGMGDLPMDFVRPFAVTGELSYAFSDSPQASPNEWDYAVSLQYSLPYFNQHVRALNVPEFFTHLIPLVEFVYAAPHGGPTTGTISPGIFYEANAWQVGAEAIIPANRATRQVQGTGFIVQFHLFLDDLLPNSLGKPLLN
jgi:hypothetical protein